MELRQVMAPSGTLHLIDPYAPGRLRFSVPLLIARHVVGSVDNGRIVWWREQSHAAAVQWTSAIDFLFIDGDPSFHGVSRDWGLWSPHVRIGGHVALHDARTFAGGWTDTSTGPVRLVADLQHDPAWEHADATDSLVVLRRIGPR